VKQRKNNAVQNVAKFGLQAYFQTMYHSQTYRSGYLALLSLRPVKLPHAARPNSDSGTNKQKPTSRTG
jgi:hypothetical protein